ncbi:MAG: MFS transporter [Anaerolineales bacterium]|nr:MFS transporter [Anaerolineales bacterium]
MRFNLFKQSDIPERYRANFLHLYFDIAWFGILSGTSVNFVNIYATRLGASALQVGALTAVSAVVNLFLAIPAGHWIGKRHTGRAVFWSSVLFRIGYVLWIPLPWLFNEQGQIWALIITTFLMAIPLTPLGVGFNALFAEAVPDRYRARVAGTRNITFAVTYMLSSLGAGYILETIKFPEGYQIIFVIGAIGAALSSFDLYHIKPIQEDALAPPSPPIADSSPKLSPVRAMFASLRLDVWKTSFKNVLWGLFLFHFAQYLCSPLYPLFNVRVLNLNDAELGNGTALYYFSVLLASVYLSRIVQKIGNKNVTAWGALGMASYPLMMAFAQNVWHYYMLSFVGGFLFALFNGAYANYMLEKIPPHDRPSHLAWYTIMLNFAILTGSLIGPAVADVIGLISALIVFGFARIVAGWFMLKHG